MDTLESTAMPLTGNFPNFRVGSSLVYRAGSLYMYGCASELFAPNDTCKGIYEYNLLALHGVQLIYLIAILKLEYYITHAFSMMKCT